MFDDPVEMRKKVAPPVELVPLSGNGIRKIKHISREHTLFYMAEGEPLTMPNDQIFLMIVEPYI